jgi:asparagine synthase (glutamine-hydrolysing)
LCGISGIYRFDEKPVEQATLERMKNSMRHRGPDDEGLFLDGPVGLAHNRLSILDLSEHGHQPMYDPQGRTWIVYNGEIYNFQETRKDLEAAGYRFRSTGDTEVILYAYDKWGRSCVDRFNGMFAFVIYDQKSGELFAARDRLGIKPLYYFVDDRQFVFASETKAILLANDVPRQIRPEALPELVAFRYVANGQTLFKDIHELKPGHWIEVNRQGVRVQQYWDIDFDSADEATDDQWVQGFRRQLAKSVQYQLISDVPVGCALSGGVDSSLVTALSCEASMSTMKTFSIGFDDQVYDERRYARQASETLGVENESRVLSESTFYENLPRLIWHMDEPINHPNAVGIWMLAKLAREKVTVLLTGEGGDELMGGYGRFQTVLRQRHLARTVPGSRLVARLVPDRVGGRASRVARELRRDDDGRMIWSSSYIPSPHIRRLFGDRGIEQAEVERRVMLEKAPRDNLINRHLYLDQKTYMASVLMRNDKMMMAESLEGRVPFLDHHVVEYAARVPTSLKVNRHQGKIALFQLAGQIFGPELFQRPKSGFGLPVAYFRDQGLAILKGLIRGRSFRERGWMDPKGVDELLMRHESGLENLAEGLWLLATLELWARAFIDRPGVIPTL